MFCCRTYATSYNIIGSSHWIGQHSIFLKIFICYRDTLKPKAYLIMGWGTFYGCSTLWSQLPAQWLKFRQIDMGLPHVFLFSQGVENSCFIYFVHLYFCLCWKWNDTIIVIFSRLEPGDCHFIWTLSRLTFIYQSFDVELRSFLWG